MFSPREILTQNPWALDHILILIVIGIVALVIKEKLIPLLPRRKAGALRTTTTAARCHNRKSK